MWDGANSSRSHLGMAWDGTCLRFMQRCQKLDAFMPKTGYAKRGTPLIFCSSKPPTHWNLGYQSIFRQESHRIGQPQWSTAPRRGSSTKPRCALQFPAMFLLLARAWLDSLTLPKYRLVWLVGPLFVWIWTIGLLWLAKLPSNCQTLVSPSRKWLHGTKW